MLRCEAAQVRGYCASLQFGGKSIARAVPRSPFLDSFRFADKQGIMPRQEYKSSRPRVPCNGRTDSVEILCCRTVGRKV